MRVSVGVVCAYQVEMGYGVIEAFLNELAEDLRELLLGDARLNETA